MSEATLHTILQRLDGLEAGMNRMMDFLERQQVSETFRITQQWYTVQEFAALTGENPRTIQKRCERGLYVTDSHVPGHRLRIHYRHVLEHLESSGQAVEVALKSVKRKIRNHERSA